MARKVGIRVDDVVEAAATVADAEGLEAVTLARVAAVLGVRSPSLYAHVDGDYWDYVGIAPVTTPDQDKKLDEIAARKGLKTGFPASLEFRQLLASHTDTFAAGPMAAAELVAQAEK